MFHLIKKEKEKETVKKEKKDKKDRMSQADLRSLEEMSIRRGFFNLHRGSSKRDSRTKLEISSPIPIKVATNAELSLTDIQAEYFFSGPMSPHQTGMSGGDLKGIQRDFHHRGSVKERAAQFGPILTRTQSQRVPDHSSIPFQRAAEDERLAEAQFRAVQHTAVTSRPEDATGWEFPWQHLQEETTRIPELVEKTFPGADLQLPAVTVQPAPEPRELEVQRRNTGDFGFSLRRTTMLDRQADGRVSRRVVHFAEPGAGTKDRALGLVPGDRLVEINGVRVESRNRDEIVEMIRQSGESVRLKVQPISELSELNHCWLRNNEKLPRDPYYDSDSDSSQSQPVASQGPDPSPVAQQPIAPSAESNSNGAMVGGDQGPQKVVKVVRRVVRNAVPAGAPEEPGRPGASEPARTAAANAPPASNTLPRASGGRPEKDDISAGLASLMGRGRTKEHRPRSRYQDRRDDPAEPEAEPEAEPAKEKEEVERTETAAAAVSPEATSDPTPPKSTPPPPTSAPGFLPGFKPDPLAPPSGFIPAPRPNPLSPPAGFIPAPRPAPQLPKPNPLARPPGFVPVARTDPLAPPPGFIPKPRSFTVKKPTEVKAASCSSVAPNDSPAAGVAPPLAAPSSAPSSALSEQVPELVPTEEDHKRVKKIFSFNAADPAKSAPSSQSRTVLDPVALLQAAHAAATQPQGKTEEQVVAEQAWYQTEKVWLVHKDGFSLATLLKTEAGSLPEGKVKIRLESDGSLLEVDEDDVEKANPPLLERVEDLASLRYLNESSVIHTLRQRYGGNLAHTHAGPNMVVINPLSTPAMYSEKVMHMFKGCRREDTAPHIYSMAQAAYRNLLTTRQDQSIVLLGKSGSGKTTNCQHLVQYLVTVAGSPGKTFSAEKWQAVYTVLEAFGNASTSLNATASRFTHVVALDFDQAGQVTSASIQTMLLEKTRVTRRPEGEATFNAFYFLLAGIDSSLRTELHLNHFAENHAFGIAPLQKAEDKQRASQQFSKLQVALKVLGVSGEEQKALWLVLGAIYHLGAAGATKAGRRQFARHEWAQKAAYLLGCSLEELSSSIFKHQTKGPTPRPGAPRPAPEEGGAGDAASKVSGLECLEAMAAGLYSEIFNLLVSFINRALKSGQHSLCSLLIVDTPGFQNPRLARREGGGAAAHEGGGASSQEMGGASFQDLCHNYTQERLQSLFHQRTFVHELERYKEENIELSLDDMEPTTSLSIAMVDQASSQALVRTLRTDEARGLLWLLEEEVQRPGASEETLLERLFSYYGPGESKGHPVLLKSERPHHFLLGHSHGTDWVEYDARRWLSYAKTNPASANAASLLQDSQKKNIRSLFLNRPAGSTVLSGSIAGLEGVSQLSLRRASSMRKTFTTGVGAIKKKSLCIQIKLQVDTLLDLVRRSRVHFVHCLLPRADALRAGGVGGEQEQGDGGDASSLMQLDVTLIRAQLRGSKLLDALRIHRQGYPDNMVFAEFRRRFDVLAPHLSKKLGRNYIVKDEKRAVEELLEALDLEKTTYHMGLSRLFFRAGSLSKLEEQRDEQTRRSITLFQAACGGYLARRAFKKRKIQDLAIRCVQKNIQKSRGVKDWPWWKLFTTVQPLVKVQLTEENMRGKDEEIQQQKARLEKVEKERNELRLSGERQESRISELLAELSDERSTGESVSQLLESETTERLRLETDLADLQARFDVMKKQVEAQEMELMETRLQKTAELNGQMEDETDDTGGEWRLKYTRALREMDFTKKKLQQEFEDKLDMEQQNKRTVERRLTELQTDQEELQRSVQQLRKKSQRLGGELQDTRLHLETQQARNHQLEKKQKRFDMELGQAQAEVQRERGQREKLARDKDLMTGEIFSLRQQLQDKEAELNNVSLTQQQLEAELHDLTSHESRDEASLAKIKKQLRDLEAKVKDQEEELDEQAGTIQMLEQAKLRLEMEMQRQRQSHSKDMDSKDEEVDEIRQTCNKKLKQMEIQLEEEYEDKQKVLRDRRELDTKLISVQDQASLRNLEGEKKLKKDLKRTKVLLADAQIMLDHLKTSAPSRREITQLKNQLEESEFTAAAAVKARKGMEMEIEDLHIQMDDVIKTKMGLEEQISRVQREKNALQARMEEDQEDLNELMKKHKAAVSQSARDLGQISELQAQLEEATKEKQEIQEKLHSLQSQLEFQEQSMVEKSLVSRQEAKIRELDTKLEYERTQIKRLESLAGRLKENLEKLSEERTQHIAAENREKEQNKRMQRQLRDIKEEMGELSKKETEASRKKHELEMDIESLEAANQSLQVDLKLAFKRIGDLQAAIEDDMETDDNDDLVNSLQDMVTKYQKRKSKTGDDTETDSEVEDRVDGVKSWMSKNKVSAKAQSDDGGLKSARHAANVDAKEGKEGKEKMSEGVKEGKEADPSRSVSVMSTLSYRKRSNLNDDTSLFSTLNEQPDAPDHASLRKAKAKPAGDAQDDRRKSQTDDMDDRGSVISMAYSEAASRARKGLDRRWNGTRGGGGSPDKDSVVSSLAPSRLSARRPSAFDDDDDDNKSTVSSVSRASPRSLQRSTSWKEERRSGSRMSLARSCGLSEFGVCVDDDDDDARSLAFNEGGTSSYSPRSPHSRSYSTPALPRSSDGNAAPDVSDVKPVTHRNYLDPDLEAAINEVLSFKPIKFKRSKLEDSDDEAEEGESSAVLGGGGGGAGEDSRRSGSRMKGDDEGLGRSTSTSSSLSRSVSGSALDYSHRSTSSYSTGSSRSRKAKKKSKVSSSESSSSDGSHSRSRSSRGKKSKKSKRKSKKKEASESEDSSSSSSSSSSGSSSSGSTISYRSSSSVKKGPARRPRPSDDEDDADPPGRSAKPAKKETKKNQKKVDNLVMKYLYKPDSD